MSNTLYRFVKASERLPKGEKQLFLRLYGRELTVGYWKKDQFQESVDGSFYQPEFVEWLEEFKVEADQQAKEIERLKGLIENAYSRGGFDSAARRFEDGETGWQKFKTEHQL